MAKPASNPYLTQFPQGEAARIDAAAFDDAVLLHGVQLVHWRAMRCPVGLIDNLDQRRPHQHHENCSNGFLYRRAGIATSVLSANNDSAIQLDIGIANSAQIHATLPRFYDDPALGPVKALPYDRFFFADESITLPHWQLFESSALGIERLTYKVVYVEELADSFGTFYVQGQDFVIADGQIKWTNRRPPFDASKNKGAICSVRYNYRPYWYVKSLDHEVRVIQAEDPVTGDRMTIPMNQAVTLQREYLFESQEKDPNEPFPNDPRQQKGPANGSFGPR